MAQPASVVDVDIHLQHLETMRSHGGARLTTGVADDVLREFLLRDTALATAIERAYQEFTALQATHAELLALDEAEQMQRVQAGIVNFYATDAVNPYVAISAQGPWIVTLKGAVVYDGVARAFDLPLEEVDTYL